MLFNVLIQSGLLLLKIVTSQFIDVIGGWGLWLTISFFQDDACVVEHVICTKPTVSSAQCDIVGFTVAKDALFGPSLLCLTEDSKCTVLPLL